MAAKDKSPDNGEGSTQHGRTPSAVSDRCQALRIVRGEKTTRCNAKLYRSADGKAGKATHCASRNCPWCADCAERKNREVAQSKA